MKKLLFPLVIVAIVGASLFLIFSIGSDRYIVNIAIQTDGATYLLSKLGDAGVRQSMAQQQSPPIYPFLEVYEDGRSLYLGPSKISEIVYVLKGDYQLHNYPEPSFDGYLTVSSQPGFTLNFENKSTEKIGEQQRINRLQLINSAGETRTISWSQVLLSSKMEALENCEQKSFNIKSYPYPGTTLVSSEKFIVVSLDQLIAFLAPAVEWSFDKKLQLLYLKMPQ